MSIKETVIDPEKLEWQRSPVPGVRFKLLFKKEETGASITLTHFPKGAGVSNPHLHPANQFMYVLKGKLSYPGMVSGREISISTRRTLFTARPRLSKIPWSSKGLTGRCFIRRGNLN